MNRFLLTRDLLLIPILSILLLNLQWVLKKSKTVFLRYIGYRNFINNLIKHVSLLVLVHVRLLFFSKLLTSCLTAVKKHWIRYYDTVYERDGINYFWSIKNSNDVLNEFKSKNFQAPKLSTYNFSTLYTTLRHHLIKDKLIDLINRTFIGRIPNIWLATKNVLFSLLMYTIITIYIQQSLWCPCLSLGYYFY